MQVEPAIRALTAQEALKLQAKLRNEKIKRVEDWIILEHKMNNLKKKCIALRDENRALKILNEKLEDDCQQYVKEKRSMRYQINKITQERDEALYEAAVYERSIPARGNEEDPQTVRIIQPTAVDREPHAYATNQRRRGRPRKALADTVSASASTYHATTSTQSVFWGVPKKFKPSGSHGPLASSNSDLKPLYIDLTFD